MTYTISKDGKMRQDFNIAIRLTRDELRLMNTLSVVNGHEGLRDFAKCQIYTAIADLKREFADWQYHESFYTEKEAVTVAETLRGKELLAKVEREDTSGFDVGEFSVYVKLM